MPEIQKASEPAHEDTKEKSPDRAEEREPADDVLVDSEALPPDPGEHKSRKYHKGTKHVTTSNNPRLVIDVVLRQPPLDDDDDDDENFILMVISNFHQVAHNRQTPFSQTIPIVLASGDSARTVC
ncbi:unnamed protein product [Dibothriocephalus latus]|uniref:Uncharacterized protein n=1 Tax=Dibothriocephalus latus TaxID=60516 RepID=A0A3P7L0F2_DIBLA|nr:unnamed protein product [Dibothriocephalus latus]